MLRQALGRFVTGVTVVATRGEANRMVGLTANSFTPVSTHAGLLLWSLATTSRNLVAFMHSDEFVVSVLAADQREVSRTMASSIEDRFANVRWRPGEVSGLPIVDCCSAWFECRKVAHYQRGDHHVFVGKVTNWHVSSKPPLLYFAGGYAHADLAVKRDDPQVAR